MSAMAVRGPEEFCLPRGYRQQAAPLTHDGARVVDERGEATAYWSEARVRASGRYQRHVYAWAAELVRSRGLKSVLDLGCGPCVKLMELIAPVCADVEGADQASAIGVARGRGAGMPLREIDLERCAGVEAWRRFDLIVCADVVEHLLDPDPMLGLIGRLSHEGTLVVMSTPDRARLRGRGCMASEKPEHVREWAEGELVGAPRGFRGLVHAPVTESGAVHLFGLLGPELGIAVEKIGTAFPDCIALKAMGGKGERWRRVRVEFEHRSSNFRAHGHEAAGCDVIVCWEHDWKDCPVEVVELKSKVEELRAGKAA